jgi:hypothetical protein
MKKAIPMTHIPRKVQESKRTDGVDVGGGGGDDGEEEEEEVVVEEDRGKAEEDEGLERDIKADRMMKRDALQVYVDEVDRFVVVVFRLALGDDGGDSDSDDDIDDGGVDNCANSVGIGCMAAIVVRWKNGLCRLNRLNRVDLQGDGKSFSYGRSH